MAILDNIAGYWTLDEGSGTRADSVAGNTLTDNNTVTSASGKINLAAQFVAANSEYLSHVSNASLQVRDESFSIVLWFQATNVTTFQAFISKWGGSTNEYRCYVEGSSIKFNVAASGDAAAGLGTLAINTWYFATAVHDSVANTIQCWINDSAQSSGSVALSGGATAGNSDFTIGALSTPSNYFDGLIDEVGFWRRALTAADITFLYNNGLGRQYPFERLTSLMFSRWNRRKRNRTREDFILTSWF